MSGSENPKSGAGGLSLPARLACVAFLLYFAAAAISANIGRFSDLTAWLLFAQDRWLLLAEALILAGSAIGLGPGRRPIILSGRTCLLLALAVIPLCYLGHAWALCGYDMSRDEQMAVFDSQIFARWQLVQPLPAPWQLHIAALDDLYVLPAAHPVAWVSAYLPINAALRALTGMVVDPDWTGPLLTALGGIALWKCARRLWPEDGEAATLALLLYLSSGQVLFAGMTAYAMSAHLTLNLLWLWLFLMDRRGSDIAALAVGALATGLHEPLFHPLFVAPFIFLLIGRRAWGRAALFTLAYTGIGLFWLAWPSWIYGMIEGGHPAAKPMGADFWTRLVWVLTRPSVPRTIFMSANLLRFAAWQPILLLPLFAIGLATARRNGMAIALAAAAILPVIAAGILMPDQGQGFGYRYVHGAIGAVILVVIYGWHDAVSRDARWRPLVVRCLAGGLLILLPAQMAMTHVYYASFAAVDRRIAASGTDYFIIGNDDAPLSNAFVVNRADLSNRPLRLFGDRVDADLTNLMCKRGAAVGMATSALYAPVNHYFRDGIASLSADRRLKKLGPQLAAAGCRVVPLNGD
ncbi:MAG TPA: hypothetical protein VK533_02620 [Sphingomonas sp.]|uniref:hypothetical protein n=1 Tax=Sphingomonas sp. TaxID=28214 RepID=UPI002C0B5EA4|nr:hypothetical protein [Sphingomonas sp.]HMI18418.1 hypothetical protein [Sphingomonas sp.]